jgi:hypothetical protein
MDSDTKNIQIKNNIQIEGDYQTIFILVKYLYKNYDLWSSNEILINILNCNTNSICNKLSNTFYENNKIMDFKLIQCMALSYYIYIILTI